MSSIDRSLEDIEEDLLLNRCASLAGGDDMARTSCMASSSEGCAITSCLPSVFNLSVFWYIS